MRKFAFSGGKGGVGKTFLAANVAMALAQRGRRVVLFDADLQLANVDVLLGVQSEFNLQHVVNGHLVLREILTPGPCGIQLVTGGSAVQGLMNAGPKRMATFLSQIEELQEVADVLIFDTGAGIDNRIMTFLRLADEVVLVATPDPTSVTDAYATAKVLIKKDPHVPISVIVNQARSDKEAKAVFGALNDITRNFLGRELHSLGSVNMDLAAVDSIRARQPLMERNGQSQVARDIAKVAGALDDLGTLRLSA
jgi:flagellar biosynthesis protein FlhG